MSPGATRPSTGSRWREGVGVTTRDKERLLRRVEGLDDERLSLLEARLDELTQPSPEEIERHLAAWRGIFGLLADPEEYAEFEERARRRSLFGGRTLDPDE